ncbi:hypothetical protein Tco_0673174 [Tanacetum coccineum]
MRRTLRRILLTILSTKEDNDDNESYDDDDDDDDVEKDEEDEEEEGPSCSVPSEMMTTINQGMSVEEILKVGDATRSRHLPGNAWTESATEQSRQQASHLPLTTQRAGLLSRFADRDLYSIQIHAVDNCSSHGSQYANRKTQYKEHIVWQSRAHRPDGQALD